MGNRVTMDGNTAAAHVAYRVNEICADLPDHSGVDRWQNSPTAWGIARHHQHMGPHPNRFKRCKAKAVRPACSTERLQSGD